MRTIHKRPLRREPNGDLRGQRIETRGTASEGRRALGAANALVRWQAHASALSVRSAGAPYR